MVAVAPHMGKALRFISLNTKVKCHLPFGMVLALLFSLKREIFFYHSRKMKDQEGLVFAPKRRDTHIFCASEEHSCEFALESPTLHHVTCLTSGV